MCTNPLRRWSTLGALILSGIGFSMPAQSSADAAPFAALTVSGRDHAGLRLGHIHLPSMHLHLRLPLHQYRHHRRYDDDHSKGRGRGREHGLRAVPRSRSYDAYRPRRDRRNHY